MKIRRAISKIIDRYSKFKEYPLTKNAPLIALFRYINFNFKNSISKKDRVYNWVNGLKFYAKKGEAGIVPNIYFKLFDYDDSMFVLNNIKENDLFIDVGANVGHFTMLAASNKANVIAIEPIPSTFERLKKNINLNSLNNYVNCLNIGIGDKDSLINFTSNFDVMNRVATPTDKNTIPVEVKTLDKILIGKEPKMIKIDVEGYEWFVLQGAKSILENKSLKYLLLELNDSSQKFEVSNEDIHNLILGYGFFPVKYEVSSQKLIIQSTYNKESFNTLYARVEKI